ncbi:hypothetical protein IKP85_05880 [bacterium]|nr:hypothetical protein [bacterium]
MISKTTFPAYNGYITEGTVFTKKEVQKVAEEVAEAIQKDAEKAKQAIISYQEQFLPKASNSYVNTEDAATSYAASHFNYDAIKELASV